MTPVLLAVAAALVPVIAAAGIGLLRHPGPARPGAPESPHGSPSTTWRRGFAVAERRLGPPVARLVGPRHLARLDRRLLAAGRPGGMTVEPWCGRAALFALLGFVLGTVVINLGLVPIGVLAWAWGITHAGATLVLDGSERQGEIDRSLPELLDVLSILVRGGMSLRPAIGRVAETFPGPAADELTHTLRRLQLGADTRSAFVELRERNPAESVGRFVAAVLQADELGTPLAAALVALADDTRSTAAHEAKRRAARAAGSIGVVAALLMMPPVIILGLAIPFFQPGGLSSLF